MLIQFAIQSEILVGNQIKEQMEMNEYKTGSVLYKVAIDFLGWKKQSVIQDNLRSEDSRKQQTKPIRTTGSLTC